MGRFVVRVPVLFALGPFLACVGEDEPVQRSAPVPAPVLSAPEPAAEQPASAEAPAQAPAPPVIPAPVIETLVASGNEKALLRALAAIPVWDAVIDRGRYLGRRGLRGVLHGRMGGSIDGYRWLIDETDGSGSLAVRLAVPEDSELREGQRLVVWGSWWVDDSLHWYWKAERMAELAPHESEPPAGGAEVAGADDAVSLPGLVIETIPAPPADAQPVSQRTEPGDITFEVKKAPEYPGEGWEIADRSDEKTVARLLLPGERASYGAQDYRRPEEHWHLQPRVRYTVRVKRFSAPRPGELTLMRAINAPRRIAPGR